jgi:hypothetical protein
MFGEAGFNTFSIGFTQPANSPKDDAVVESEEFEANEAGQRESNFFVILEPAVSRPGVVTSCRDHCQD